jgi:predicted dinucleotide-binding enzyme
MRIAIIGAGSVGSTLAVAFLAKGHALAFGVRNPEADKYRELALTIGRDVRFRRLADAVADAEAVILATPWSETERALAAAGDLAGKIVLDATNPLKPNLAGLEWKDGLSGGE